MDGRTGLRHSAGHSPGSRLGGSARHRRPAELSWGDALIVGAGSGLSQTALSVLTLALGLLTAQVALPGAWILGAAQAGPIALAAALWLFIRRGGMVSRRVVVVLWFLAAVGLAGLALIPPAMGWPFVILAAGCMALLGTGVAVGYHVQANKLSSLENDAGDSAPRVSGAAGLAQRWTLFMGVLTTVGVGLAMQRLGVSAGIGGMACLVAVYAAAHVFWRGLPEKRRGVGHAAVVALRRQSAGVRRDTTGSFVLYGAWGALYPVVALLGAGPATQAWIMIIARGFAAAFVVWLGRLADRDRQRIVRAAAMSAAGGVVVVMSFRSGLGWGPASLGVALTELGANGVAGAIKGSLAHGEDGVRLMQLGNLFRFAGAGLIPLALDGIWASLSPGSVEDAREAVAVAMVSLLVIVLAIVPSVVSHPGTHPVKATGRGVLYLTVLAPAPRATRLWLHVWVPGDGNRQDWTDEPPRPRKYERAFFDLAPGAVLTVVDRTFGGTLLELHSLRHRRPARRRASDGSVAIPPAGPAWCHRHSLDVVAAVNGGDKAAVVGTLDRLTVWPVAVRTTVVSADAVPKWFSDDRRRAARKMGRDVTGEPVIVYEIRSEALGSSVRRPVGPGPRIESGRVPLRINSMVFPPGHA
jgi:hypothetical protein